MSETGPIDTKDFKGGTSFKTGYFNQVLGVGEDSKEEKKFNSKSSMIDKLVIVALTTSLNW